MFNKKKKLKFILLTHYISNQTFTILTTSNISELMKFESHSI